VAVGRGVGVGLGGSVGEGVGEGTSVAVGWGVGVAGTSVGLGEGVGVLGTGVCVGIGVGVRVGAANARPGAPSANAPRIALGSQSRRNTSRRLRSEGTEESGCPGDSTDRV
jgi:hypothetical protein